jgi:aspartate kinase
MSLADSQSSTPTSYTEELVRNSSSDDVPWVIQKYGGTSVGKSLESICNIVEYVDTFYIG